MPSKPPGDAHLDSRQRPPVTITSELLQRAKQGDSGALDRIMERYLPRLQRWASGRLPSHARSMLDTADLVQETLLRTLQGLERVEVRGPGGFQAYVRQAILNRMRNEIRSAANRTRSDEVLENVVDTSPSPLENVIGADLLSSYERGMASLDSEDQQILHLRIELGFDYAEIAAMTGRPGRDAVRMAFQRALGRLAEAMGRER